METNETQSCNMGYLMPFIHRPFQPGACKEMIEAIEDPDEQAIAWAGYYQQRGESKEAVERAEVYADHPDPFLRLSSCAIRFFSGLGKEDDKCAKQALAQMESITFDESLPFSGEFFAGIIRSMMFSDITDFQLNLDALNALPEGSRFYINYFFALHELLQGRDDEAIGIAKSALMLGATRYPIQATYLYIILGAAYTFRRDIETADRYYKTAWDLARPDGLTYAFVQQCLLLLGFDRRYIKGADPDAFKKLEAHAKRYLSVWIPLCDNIKWFDNSESSKVELTVGMLYKHKYRAKEIGDAMRISVNTVKTHLRSVRQKVMATKRDELLKIHFKKKRRENPSR